MKPRSDVAMRTCVSRAGIARWVVSAFAALSLLGCASESLGAASTVQDNPTFQISRDNPTVSISGQQLTSRRGSIAMWVRPAADLKPDESVTLLSGRWATDTNAYMTISQGWWEPAGQGKLFFIVNNQDRVHCKADHEFIPGAWTHIVATWDSGAPRTCQLYVDGKLLAASAKATLKSHKLDGPVTLGNDSSAERAAKRQFRGDLVVDVTSSAVLSPAQIATAFESGQSRFDPALLAKNAWIPQEQSVVTQDERRVIFFETREWAESPAAVERAVERTLAGGFNVLIPCVWHGRGTRYPSSRAAWEKELEHHRSSGFDPLDALIKAAHEKGIEVHPWFTVVKREGDWRPEFAPPGTPQYAYDVHRPEFRDYIVGIISEVVQKYPIDGINLDYIRSIGFCQSSECKDEYRDASAHSLAVDLVKRRVNAAAAERLRRWNASAVGDIVRRVDQVRRELRCEIPLTVDAHPSNKAIALQGQDSMAWVNAGWIDVIFSMDYDERPKFGQASSVIDQLPSAEHFTLLFSNASRVARREWRPREADQLVGFVNASRLKWPASGSSFWHMPRFSDATLRELGERAYAGDVAPRWPSRTQSCSAGDAASDASPETTGR